ncbi:Protein GLUTAMINE DUMPER 3 [Camellia lanceoleosa]|uniref:Protein GLUTAMINE DUMPER 3 n=1 Tax=Camellia lanceoleosa TaxID=1840588 RepID=A0ACC0FPJ0_9ERIC|nr:Protein GLUTAMINE DUMPER 3 [Camellia lanceoleosa]
MMSTEMVSEAPMVSAVQRSPWHSPVPYLFGGLAAMLGLISFALLILACSYWKLSGYLDRDNDDANSADRDVELGADADSGEKPKLAPLFEEKYLVIMAGQAKPTFLATPISSRASSFGSNSSASQMPDNKSDGGDRTDNPKDNQSQEDQTENAVETHETSYQVP